MSATVLVKETTPQWIASVREVIANYPAIGHLYPRLFEQIGTPSCIVMPIAIWHDMEQKEQDVDAEAGVLLTGPLEAHGTAMMYELPTTMVASYMHRGAFHQLPKAYEIIMSWVKENRYRPAGPIRELYHHITQVVRQDDDSYVTEIQIPVIQISA